MRFVYPAQLERCGDKEVVVSFRDVPRCHTLGEDVAGALTEGADALEEAIAGCIDEGAPIPEPSVPREGEYMVALTIDMAAKAALATVFRASDLTQAALAERLGVTSRTVRRMLIPVTVRPRVVSMMLFEPSEARPF